MALRGGYDDAIAVYNRASSAWPTVRSIVLDPAFPAVITRVRTLYDAMPSSSGPSTGGAASKLQSLIKPLDAMIYLQRNPWALFAGIAAGIAIIGGIGYRMGQRRAPR